MLATFDKHPNIRYSDLVHLFWGEFPYRAVIEVPHKQRQRCKDFNAVKRARDRILDDVIFDGDLSFRKNADSVSFFFHCGEEAARFIDDNAARIREVTRPACESHIDALQDGRVQMRDRLFFDQYRFIVTFRGRTYMERDEVVAEVDDFVRDTFEMTNGSISSERCRYQHGKHSTRRLYLRDEADVILVKLALDDEKIAGIEIAKLKSEMTQALAA
jgi:hypothetical protein